MDENREVKSAREIAIVIAIIVVCFVGGIFVHEKFIKTEENEGKKVESSEEEVPTKIDYSKYANEPKLNEFYDEFGYTDIRTLGENYSSQDAINSNCFVKIHLEKYNENLLDLFIENMNNDLTSSIRIIETTIEGEIIITDIKYDSNSKNVKVVRDFTRDTYMNKEDATITYVEYETVEKYEYRDQEYLVIHNGVLDDYSFENETTNIIISL